MLKLVKKFKTTMEKDVESSEYDDCSDSDAELQEAFAKGLLKPGLNVVNDTPKTFNNNIQGLDQKLQEFKQDIPWLETLDAINKQAPLAPELAAQIHEQEQKRDHRLRNNKKLSTADVDPVLNDFKREMIFYRQAQAAVLNIIPRLKSLGIPTKRPDDYFAEMAKTDDHMQKIRTNLVKRQNQQKTMEKVKQLRAQRKEGKALQKQNVFKAQQDKKEMLDKIKKVRKGMTKDLSFLDDNKKGRPKTGTKRSQQKREFKNQKYGFGGRKKGGKQNEENSSADVSGYRRSAKPNAKNLKTQRPGKNKRIKLKNNKRKTKK